VTASELFTPSAEKRSKRKRRAPLKPARHRYGRRAQKLTRFAAGSTVRVLTPARIADARRGTKSIKTPESSPD